MIKKNINFDSNWDGNHYELKKNTSEIDKSK